MERAISEKVQRLTRILLEEADRFPRISVGQYSSGRYGYDWKVYLDEERYLGTISFTTEVPLRGRTPGSIPARAESGHSESGSLTCFNAAMLCVNKGYRLSLIHI